MVVIMDDVVARATTLVRPPQMWNQLARQASERTHLVVVRRARRIAPVDSPIVEGYLRPAPSEDCTLALACVQPDDDEQWQIGSALWQSKRSAQQRRCLLSLQPTLPKGRLPLAGIP